MIELLETDLQKWVGIDKPTSVFIDKINELVEAHNALEKRFQNTLDTNELWDGS